MAVIAMWQCDRDGSMFTNKKDADAHDKMLELAEGFSAVMEQHIEGLNDDQIEAIGLLLAKNKAEVMAACKGNVESLASVGQELDAETNVTPLKSGA